MTKENSRKIKTAVFIIVPVVIVIAVAVGISNLLQPKATYTSGGKSVETTTALQCKISATETAFFHADEAMSESHDVKFTFKDGVVDTMTFTYTGNFADAETEKKVSAELHARYNEYMATTSVNQSDLLPNFSNIDNQLVIALYLNEKTLTADTARLLFLNTSDASNIKKYSIDTLKKNYENNKFYCKVSN